MTDILERARVWVAGDPDPETRAVLEAMIESEDTSGLDRAMGGTLSFGTAGIRGEVGPGSNRMNRAVVIRTTRGLADYLISEHGGPPKAGVILGFDARPSSRQFAEDAAGVLAGAGIQVGYFPEVTPTPLVAYAAKHYEAAAAVVVTASHNPPADNGYKVYGANAAQIIPPVDIDIAAAIDRVGPANEVQRVEAAFSGSSDLVTRIPEDVYEGYRAEVNAARPNPQVSDFKIVYTPLHGVGSRILNRLCAQANHTGIITVPEQEAPDGRFPTVSFPNPEEPGALDLALALAKKEDAGLLIANDPDADRLAAAVPSGGEWRLLSGNELGALLGDYVLRYWTEPATPIVVNSVVSSPMLGEIAKRRNARHEVTLTGFKWIINAGLALETRGEGSFAFGYEEALGYSVGKTVRDKDGMSAALVLCDLVAQERAQGRDLLDRLYDLWAEVGLWVSSQYSVGRSGPNGQQEISSAVEQLAANPPKNVGDHEVVAVIDYRRGAGGRPIWLGEQDLIELELADVGRVLVRPSGTEPKIKVYVDLQGDPGTSPDESHRFLTATAAEMAKEVGEGLAF
ncbi:MAG TPA: phospho-sugar mutase [Acidimicrobiia bacterium]